MRRPSLSSLPVQAILWTLLPLTLIFVGIGSVGTYAYSAVVSQLIKDRDRELARVSADRLSENLRNHADVLQVLATHDYMTPSSCTLAVLDDLRAENDCLASQKNLLITTIRRNVVQFDGGVTIFRPDGTPRLSASAVPISIENGNTQFDAALRTLPPERSYAGESFFQAALAAAADNPSLPQPFFSDVVLRPGDPLLEAAQIIVTVPILAPDGTLTGVLAGSFLLENETLGRQEIARLGVGTAYLVDSTGRLIWHPDEQRLGDSFLERRAVRALVGNPQRPDALEDVDESGDKVVVGYASVEGPGWGLVIQESWDALLGPVRSLQWIMLGTLLLGIVLGLVMISSGTRRITEPIQELVAQTQQLSKGDLVGEVQGGSIEEMRALSHAFNEMADRVARYRAGLQSYVSAITHSQEEERKRIARELHDDTIQSLIALGRRLELMEPALENPIEAAKQLYLLQQMVTQTVAEVRQFSRDLRPLLLEDVGLEAALRQMLREIERRDGLSAELTLEGSAPAEGLDDELEVALYRIAQEALNNIRKHAGAQRIAVTLCYQPDAVQLVVQDDGNGFSLAETTDLARRGSFGLMGIRERAKLFGGHFAVTSAPGEGTRLTVQLPLRVAPEWVLAELQGSALAPSRA